MTIELLQIFTNIIVTLGCGIRNVSGFYFVSNIRKTKKILKESTMKKNIVVCGIIMLSYLCLNLAFSQENQVVNDSLYSEILKEQRTLEIFVPGKEIAGSRSQFEVIYLLDGEWNFKKGTFIHDFARYENFIPPAIIVGVRNTYINGQNQRDRDFLPDNAADTFIAFLKEELIPYIEKKYPANGERTLYGHSYGGLFVGYTFLNYSDLFDAFIASDPAFAYNDRAVVKLASEKLPGLNRRNKSFWMAGLTNTANGMGITAMDSVFKVLAPKNLHWKSQTYPNETHNSVQLKGIYDGLKFIYEGYDVAGITFHPMNGIVLKGEPFKVMCFSNNPNIRYTTDGSEPTANSPKFEREIILTGPANLKVNSFYTRGKNEALTTGEFKEGKTISAMEEPENVQPGGLKYSYYEGEWDELPDFSKIKFVSSGHMDKNFDFTKLLSKINFGCVFSGYIKIEKRGYYIFGIQSDDGAKVIFNGQLILNNDGLHDMRNPKSFILPLEIGFYPVKIEYFQKLGGTGLNFMYLRPGEDEPIPVPNELLYSSLK